MKKTILYILVITNIIFSAFEQYNPDSARVAGLGGSYVGLSDDAASVFYNPAGVSKLTKIQVLSMYSKMLPNLANDKLSKSTVAAVTPINNKIGFGLGIREFNSELYKEKIINLSASYSHQDKIDFGLSLKAFNLAINSTNSSVNDPVFENSDAYNSIGFSLDFGVRKDVTDNISVGLSCLNLTSTKIGVIQKEGLPLTILAGSSISIFNKKIFIVCDIGAESSNPLLRTGIEYYLFDKLLVVRGGFNLENAAIGCGIALSFFKLDYSYEYFYYMQGLGNNQNISAVLEF